MSWKSEYHKKYYEENKEKLLKQNKEWNKNNKEKVRSYGRKYDKKTQTKDKKKKYRKNNIERFREYEKRYYQSSEEVRKKQNARAKANKKIKIPKNKMCEICKINKAVERSHSNYDKPLKVELLCKPCHIIKDRGLIL